MANTVLLKRSSVAGKAPVTANLQYGELSINYTDGALYYRTSTDTIGSFLANGTSYSANVFTANSITTSGNVSIGGNISVINRSYVKFTPTGSSNWIGLRAPSSISANVTFNLPSSDGTSGQVLKTDGAGNWSFGSASGSGGSSGFFSSTITTHPAAAGSKDLATGADNVTLETPFSTGGTDAFGVSLGIVYDEMEPIGSYTTIDLGSAVAI